jgi:hypothetical protein
MFVIVERLYGTWRGGKGKEKDKESTILKYKRSVEDCSATLFL